MCTAEGLTALKACRLCPRACGADRTASQRGVCGEGETLRIGRAALHMWEEPCISGAEGSGAVFFAGCSLRCVFCQNHSLAEGEAGIPVSIERLTEIFYELAEQGANNINLVTPDHFLPQIALAIRQANAQGFALPFVWNSGGYVNAGALRQLEGLVDIYLTDFKYWTPETAGRYANAPDYPETAKAALAEMVRQCPEPVFDRRGMMQRGVIIRHLLGIGE